MCARVCACVMGYSNPARSGKGLPALRSLYVSFCGCHQRLGGDGLFSFNSKLAVLVSEPDVQIKKVRHAHLILVKLPLHISPACQLLCDSNHHRHMPLLCAAPPPTTHAPLMQSSCFFYFARLTISRVSGQPLSKAKQCRLSKMLQLVGVGHSSCLSTF